MSLRPDPISDFLGIGHWHSEGGVARCELIMREALLNPNGVAHGAVAFTMADDAMGYAVHSLLGEGERCASIEIEIHYLRPVRNGTLKAEARVIHLTKRLAFTTCEVVNGQGEAVALATGTYSRFRKRTAGGEA